jgi:hypothetical protein
MINFDAAQVQRTERSKGDGAAQEKLLYDVQQSLREALAKASKTPDSKIGLIGAKSDETGMPETVSVTKSMGSPAQSEGHIFKGIGSATIGVPNPVDSLPALSIDDNRLAPSIERFEQLRRLSKDQHLTRDFIESAVVDERLSASDREKFKALLPHFDTMAQWLPMNNSFVDLETAQAIDRVNSRNEKFEKTLEKCAPEIFKSLKYITDNFSSLDQGFKGYLTSMDYESALLNPKLDPEARKALANGLDHEFFGRMSDIRGGAVAEAGGKNLLPSFNQAWAFLVNTASPYQDFTQDLKSIKEADDDLRLRYLQLSTGTDADLGLNER